MLPQEAGDPDGAEQQHGHWDDEFQHREDSVHADQDDDGPRCLFVGGEEETLGVVATAFDVVVSQHGDPRADHQQPDQQRDEHGLPLGQTVESMVRVNYLEPEDSDGTFNIIHSVVFTASGPPAS